MRTAIQALILSTLAACARRAPAPTPPATPAPVTHRATTSSPAPHCFLGELCRLEGDFDGDGRKDSAVPVAGTCHDGECAAGFVFQFANGETARLGLQPDRWLRVLDPEDTVPGAQPTEEEDIPEDLSFLMRWDVYPGKFPRTHVPLLHGDAVLLDTGDLAFVVWRAAGRWHMYDLGY
jgi:hypothetical protein